MNPGPQKNGGSPPAGLQLRVTTFNLRNCRAPDGENDWSHRRDLVVQFLRENAAGIIGVQEAYKEQVAYLEQALPGYAYAGVGRDDGREQGEYAAVFYQRDRFTLLEQETFWLSRTPALAGSKFPGTRCCRVATRLRLGLADSPRRILVFNTHLDHQAKPAQRHGVELIKQAAQASAQGDPVILMGDFNCTPADEAYAAAVEGDPFPFRDSRALSETPPEGPAYTYHEFKPPGTLIIDYIFVGPGIRVGAFRVVDRRFDGRCPSDHLPVVADLLLPG